MTPEFPASRFATTENQVWNWRKLKWQRRRRAANYSNRRSD
jgi:hypothetical protein